MKTLLTSAKVSQEIRGKLHSLGVAGVQAGDFDGHDYMAEKRKALLTLHRLLDANSQ